MFRDFKNLSVIDFAQQVRQSPGMYFGKDVSLSNLENMLWGFNLNSEKESIVPFQYFNYWTKHKLNKFGSTYNWAVAIKETCDGNEEKAFWKFFELLDEFVLLKPNALLTAELNSDNLAFYYSKDNTNKQHRIIGTDNRFILDPAPYHVRLFEFDYCVHSYHFDYFWLVEEYDKNIYYNHFESIQVCKAIYKGKFNISIWTEPNLNEVQNLYQQTIGKCRNRRYNII